MNADSTQWDVMRRRSFAGRMVERRLEDWARFRKASRRRQMATIAVGAGVACLVAVLSVAAWRNAETLVPALSSDEPSAASGAEAPGSGAAAAGADDAGDGFPPAATGDASGGTNGAPSDPGPSRVPDRNSSSPAATPTPAPRCDQPVCVIVTATVPAPIPTAPPAPTQPQLPTLPALIPTLPVTAPTVLSTMIPTVVSAIPTVPPAIPTLPVEVDVPDLPDVPLPPLPVESPPAPDLCPPIC